MERRVRREAELPAIVLSTAAAIRPPAPPRYNQIVRRHRWPSILVFLTLFVGTAVANALAEEYVVQAIAGAGASGERWRGVLDRELEVTRGALARSEESLKAFTRANPAVPDDPRDSLEYRKLADLNDALTKAQSRRMEKEALHKQVRGGNGGFLSQVATNQVVAGLATEIAKLEAERVHAGDGTPAATRIQGQVDALRRELRTSHEALADTVRADFEAAKKQEA